MIRTTGTKGWLKGVIGIVLIGIVLAFPVMGYMTAVRAQAAMTQTPDSGIKWEYQLDFTAPTLPSARLQAASLTPGLDIQGVASEMQPLGGSNYRLTTRGDKSIEQVRQVLYSPLIAGFIGGAAVIEVTMPADGLLDTTFTLESNPTTGYRWEILPSESSGFVQAGEPTFKARSSGYGVPSVQTLVLHPQNLMDGKVKLIYRRSFGPADPVTRHLVMTLAAPVTDIDLSNPHPKVVSAPARSSASPNTPNPIAEIPVNATLPDSLDWRTAGIVPAIRNQRYCGSCWAFGTVGVMESAILKAGGPLTDLSEQFLVSCNTAGWNCEDGGLTAHMWHFDSLGINQTAVGAVLEADKPYTATDGSCNVAYNHPFALSGWQFIVSNESTLPTVEQIKNAIYTYGPVTAGVCVDYGWYSYSGGVYNPSSNHCDGGTDHQIILVGWDDATSTWILRNSWGPYWGENGYMHIRWDTTGTKSRVGEGTSWVTWAGYRLYIPLLIRVPAD